MNQSQFLAITWNSLKVREKSRVHGAIGFGFDSHWLKKIFRASFPTALISTILNCKDHINLVLQSNVVQIHQVTFLCITQQSLFTRLVKNQ